MTRLTCRRDKKETACSSYFHEYLSGPTSLFRRGNTRGSASATCSSFLLCSLFVPLTFFVIFVKVILSNLINQPGNNFYSSSDMLTIILHHNEYKCYANTILSNYPFFARYVEVTSAVRGGTDW